MSPKRRIRSPLAKRAKRGFCGYPIATVAYYRPNDKMATKVAVGIIPTEHGDVESMERWLLDMGDVRLDPEINEQILAFIKTNDVKSVVVSDGIIGCAHEEGIDYPEGEHCPHCPYWADRDRWSGEKVY